MVQIGSNSYRPLDMGQVFRDVEDVKSARQNRKIREHALKQVQQEDEAVKGYLEGTVGPEVFAVMGGDRALKTFKVLNAMGEQEREEAKRRNEEVGQVSSAILNAPPEQQPSLYARALEMLPPQVAERLPPEWGPEAENAARLGLATAVSMDKLFGAMQDEKKESRQHRNKLAEIDAQGDKEIRVSRETEGVGGMKSADSNAIGRATGELYGGRYNPQTGEFAFADKTMAQQALAVAARAEEIYAAAQKAGRPIGHRQAAKRAFEEISGKTGKGKGGGDNAMSNDPLGIR